MRDDVVLRLRPTARFAVLEVDHGGDSVVPRLPLALVGSAACRALLESHGFVVVTSIGAAVEGHLARLEARMAAFYGDAGDDDEAAAAVRSRWVGSVYCNERGLPMYRVGSERQRGVRDCFRVRPATSFAEAGLWPDAGFREAWRAALDPLRALADAALGAALGEEAKKKRPADGDDDDYSIAYSFRYPNTAAFGGAHCDDPEILVAAHADPSLVVVTPITQVPGLELLDPVRDTWLSVADLHRPGTADLLLFAGKALHHAAKDAIPPCLHRVRKHADEPRMSLIYEQKYAAFFQHLRTFSD